jgi:AraC family transcriptional regulator
MSEQAVKILLNTETLAIRDVVCLGRCRHKSARECAASTNLVFPYRGLFVRHAGRQEAVADANQLLFFNAAEDYCVSHPVEGGDACLSLIPRDHVLEELAPKDQLARGERVAFRCQNRRLTAKAQLLAAQLRHALRAGTIGPLEAEELALGLVRAALGERWQAGEAHAGRRKLVDRVKLVLASDPARRWTLAGIGAEVGVSPVYLTQLFRQVEDMPLSRYQLLLRLARALDLIPYTDNLTRLGLELGFSSHSHFTFAFRRAYGQTPGQFRRGAALR